MSYLPDFSQVFLQVCFSSTYVILGFYLKYQFCKNNGCLRSVFNLLYRLDLNGYIVFKKMMHIVCMYK